MSTLQQIITTLTALVMALSAQVGNLGHSVNSNNPNIAAIGQVLGASTNGLVGYWNFDEGSGTTVIDTSGNNNSGVITGATWTTGKVNSALNFNGSNQYVIVGNPSSLQISGDISMCSWVYYRNSSKFILAKSDGATRDYAVYISSAGYLTLYSGAGGYTSAPNTVPSNQWSHVCITVTSGQITYYINNQVIAGATTAIANTGKTLAIGRDGSSPGFDWDGYIDEVRIYNRALSASEVTDVYNDGGTVTPPPTGDTTPPSTPTNLSTSAISSSQINLAWSGSSDNVGVIGYKIFRNGSQVGTSATTNYSDFGLSPSTSYSYTVSAYDAASNNSSQSTSASATTQAGTPPPPPPSGSNIYISQNGTGTQDASSCSNAKPVSFFNTAGNWGTGSTQIGPGKTVRLCGTFTGGNAATLLTFQGSGTSGNQIVLFFEPSAVVQASYCAAAGCINLNGKSNIVIDGGNVCGETSKWGTIPCNGVIQNTLAGSSGLICPGGPCVPVAGTVSSSGVGTSGGSPSNIEVRNLRIHMYTRRASDTSDGGTGTTGVGWGGGALSQGISVHNMIIDGVGKAMVISLGSSSGTLSGYQMYNSNISDQCWAMGVGANAPSMNITGLSFHDNEVSNWDNWAPANTTGNVCHTNGTMWFNGDGFTVHSGTGFIGDSSSMIYNNYLHGNLAGNAPGTSPSGYLSCQDNCVDIAVFNNIINDTSTGTDGGGAIYFNGAGGGNQKVFNNTIIRPGGSCVVVDGRAGQAIIKNNVYVGCGDTIEIRPNTPSAAQANYNDGFNIGAGSWTVYNSANSGQFLSLATWRSAYSQDINSVTGNPLLDANYKPLSGSAAIGAGINLTSLGISALNIDAAGVARPASGPWDIGVYQVSSSPPVSNTTWYVRQFCANNGDGTASTCASSAGGNGSWKGFSNIVWSSILPGNTLYLVSGETYSAPLNIGKSGSAGSPITISVTGGGTAIIDGANGTSPGINMSANSYVNVDGLYGNAAFGGSTIYGIKIINIGSSTFCAYENNGGHHYKFLHIDCSGTSATAPDDNRGGFYLTAGNIGGVEVAYNWIHGPNPTQKWAGTCVTLWGSTGSTNFNDNLEHDNKCENMLNDGLRSGANTSIYNNEVSHIEGSGHSDSILCQSGSYCAIYNNYIHNSGDQNIYLDNLYNSTCGHVRIYNNVINSNPGFGVIVDPEGGAGAGTAISGCSSGTSSVWDDVIIVNNTFYSTSAAQIRWSRRGAISNMVVKNNIFGTNTDSSYNPVDLGNGGVSFLDANAWNYNVYSTAGINYPLVANFSGLNNSLAQLRVLSPAREVNGNVGLPSYTNIFGNDFHLSTSDTTAIGKGVNLYSTYSFLRTDKDGVARPSTGSWDIGAYQYTGTITPPPTSTKFTTGQRVQTTSNVNVRATASASGTLLGTQSLGALGTIVSGGQSVDGYFWWNVNYDNAPDGYSVENYLTAYSTPIVGDFNNDGLVNSIDLSLLTSAWNTTNSTYDLNHDNLVNSLDYVIMVQNWSL